MVDRKPVVANTFYPGGESELRAFVVQALAAAVDERAACGVVAPHAGYVYSGATTGKTFGAVRVPDVVVMLGPNHTGLGTDASVAPAGRWLTPLGPVEVESELAGMILESAPVFEEDSMGHAHEHSLEVLLPFIQVKNPSARIVPIAFMTRDSSRIREAGIGLAHAIRASGKDALIVASSDMTHYEPAAQAGEKDKRAVRMMETLDPDGLLDTVKRFGISMCGAIPVTVMLHAARELGSTGGTLVEYTHSGVVTGDTGSVVGYAGIVVS